MQRPAALDRLIETDDDGMQLARTKSSSHGKGKESYFFLYSCRDVRLAISFVDIQGFPLVLLISMHVWLL